MRKIIMSVILGLALACGGTHSPIASLYVTGNAVQTLKTRANVYIATMCPDSVTSDSVKLVECQNMASENATAQASVTEAIRVARAALDSGNQDSYQVALVTLTQALCSVSKIVPGVVIDGLDTSTCN